jgi:hypothetical protein
MSYLQTIITHVFLCFYYTFVYFAFRMVATRDCCVFCNMILDHTNSYTLLVDAMAIHGDRTLLVLLFALFRHSPCY